MADNKQKYRWNSHMTEIINFRVGRYKISFEILNILMTEKYEGNATQVPSGDGTLLGVINYQKVPTPIYDLSMILEGVTAKDKMSDLVELLHAREKDHVDWINSLEESIETGSPFTKAKDPKQCTFGKWYESFESENDDLTHILKKFDEPHVQIHHLADPLLTQAQNEGKEEALKTLSRHKQKTLGSLRGLFAAAREAVTSSYKPVIVYTTLDGSTPCLGFLVESVEDALTIEGSDIKSFSNDGAIQFMGDLNLPEMISGLITKNDVNSLLIDPKLVTTELPETA